MTDLPPKAARAPRWMKLLLAASLAVNLGILGLAAGAHFKGGPDRSHRSEARAAAQALGPMGRALRPEDRRAILSRLRADGTALRAARQERAESQAQIARLLRADPFDRSALAAILARQRLTGGAIVEQGQAALLDHLAQMSPKERQALAERLAKGGR